jgi:putative NADPH-quinone reductase
MAWVKRGLRKSVLITAVSGFPEDFYKKDGQLKMTIEEVLYPMQNGIFSFCGLDVIEPFIVYNSLGLSSADYEKAIKDYHFKITHLIDSPSYWRKTD